MKKRKPKQKRSTRDGINRRRALVKKLYELGLKTDEIARVSGWSRATTVVDINALRKMGQLREKPVRKEANQLILNEYLQLLDRPLREEAEKRLFKVIKERLKVDEILSALSAAYFVLGLLTYPRGVPQKDLVYARLLAAIFNISVCLPEPKEAQDKAQKLWKEFCQIFQASKQLPDDILRACLNFLIESYPRRFIVWPIDGRQIMDEVLKQHLKPQEYNILSLRCGLKDGQLRLLKEIAQLLNLSRERVRQIEIKAIERLRHPKVKEQLRPFIVSLP
jgi:transposase